MDTGYAQTWAGIPAEMVINSRFLTRNGGIEGEVDREGYKFLEDDGVHFSVEAAQQVVRAGVKVANNYEDARHAARQVQEIHMGKMSSLSQNARDLLAGDPELGDQIARLHEVGALPFYGGPPAGTDRVSVMPYGESKTHLMVSKIWGM